MTLDSSLGRLREVHERLVQELGSVLMWVGVGVVVLGLIVGAVLKGMGMGYEGEVRKHERGELKH